MNNGTEINNEGQKGKLVHIVLDGHVHTRTECPKRCIGYDCHDKCMNTIDAGHCPRRKMRLLLEQMQIVKDKLAELAAIRNRLQTNSCMYENTIFEIDAQTKYLKAILDAINWQLK